MKNALFTQLVQVVQGFSHIKITKIAITLLLSFGLLDISVASSTTASATSASSTSAVSSASSDSPASSSASVSSAPLLALKERLSGVSTLQANFQQTVKNEQGRVLQKNSGKMWLKKPGKFRWEVKGKDQRLVLGDGKKVWDYDIDLEQVTVQKMSAGQTQAPIFFLTGEVDTLSRDFTVSPIASVSSASTSRCLTASDQCFELTPKQAQGPFQWIRVGFKNKLLKELELLDQLGQHSIFVFDQLVLNASIPQDKFQFTPPKGVDVMEQ